MARSKRSAEREAFWRLVVKQQRRSGLSIRAFCQQKALSEPSFYAWRKEIGKRDQAHVADASHVSDEGPVSDASHVSDEGPGADATAQQQRLIPVDIVGAVGDGTPLTEKTASPFLEIVTPGGFALRFDHNTTPQQLDALLRVIAGCQNGAASC